MAKITRIQRPRLVASGIAFFLTAVLMMPTTTDARGSFGGHGGRAHHFAAFSFTPSHASLTPGIAIVRRGVSSSQRRTISRRNVALRQSRVIGSDFFALGTNGVWADSFESAPTVVVMQEPVLIEQQAAPPRAVVRTPSTPQDGIIVVRGNSKSYVTFPAAKSG